MCTKMPPHVTAIPSDWKVSVIAVLRREYGLRTVVQRAQHEWRNLDDSHTIEGLYALLADVLEENRYTRSKPFLEVTEPGEAYQFCFDYQPPRFNRPISLFAKINLREGRRAVLVISAHP
jgi:hypothetical protein